MTTKETSIDTSANTTAKVIESKPPLKKHRWRRRLLWFFIIVSVIAFLLNGIVARQVIHHFLNKNLEAQGLTGSVEIQGSIISGFEVKKLRYSGEQGIQLLNIDQITVDYKLIELTDLKIKNLTLSKLEIIVDIAKFPNSKKATKSKDWKESLQNIRPLILNPQISLEDLDITILNNSKKLSHLNLSSIKHEPNSDNITINQWQISHSEKLTTPEQSTTLSWNEQSLTIDQLQLLPELSLINTNADWSSNIKANTTLIYYDAQINATISDILSATLTKGKIRLEELSKTLTKFDISLNNLDIVLNKFQINIPLDQIKESTPISSWKVDTSIAIESGKWEKFTLSNTKLKLSQNNNQYQVNINGTTVETPLKLDILGSWTKPSTIRWWESTSAKIKLETKLNDKILELIPSIKNIPSELKINQTRIQNTTTLELENTNLVTAQANFNLSGLSVKDESIPNFSLETVYKNQQLEFVLHTAKNSSINIAGTYNSKEKKYTATFISDTKIKDSPWINALAKAFQSPFTLNDKLSLKWKGIGNIKTNQHSGEITTDELILVQKDSPVTKINLTGNYNYPNSFDLKNLSISQAELFASASVAWNGKEISIRDSIIKRHNELIGKILGKVPYSLNIDSTKKFFAQQKPWDIRIDTESLKLKRLSELIPLPNNLKLEGTLQTTLLIAGSPHSPSLNGNIDIESLNDILKIGLNDISLKTKFSTKDNILRINGDLLEKKKKRIDLKLALPFTPKQWLEDNNLLKTIQNNSQIKGTAEIKQLPLGEFSRFIPELEKLDGVLDIKANFSGTIAEPKYKINFDAKLPIIRVKSSGFDDITDIRVKGGLDQSMILKSELNAKINGGKFITKININFTKPNEPKLDVNLKTNHALLYRDDSLAMRANTNLFLKGTLQDATISGNVGILESLFYKDIDLIPIGVPSTAVSSISLPTMNTKAKNSLPIPKPFADWKLDLTVKTIDPILIRGNLGKGSIEGSIKVRGTLAKPNLDGTFLANKVQAKLPFSFLKINSGRIIFRPNQGFIPKLSIRGKSQVGVYNVNIFVYGSAADPKITLSSYPALPENEIMTLLATGTTNSGLANRDVATFKTLQILLLELKQRSDRPGGNRLFSKLLSGIDDLNLKVGEVNELTGQKYASATVKLHRRWYLTAQVDNDRPPQTRGLVIFALRFR